MRREKQKENSIFRTVEEKYAWNPAQANMSQQIKINDKNMNATL